MLQTINQPGKKPHTLPFQLFLFCKKNNNKVFPFIKKNGFKTCDAYFKNHKDNKNIHQGNN